MSDYLCYLMSLYTLPFSQHVPQIQAWFLWEVFHIVQVIIAAFTWYSECDKLLSSVIATISLLGVLPCITSREPSWEVINFPPGWLSGKMEWLTLKRYVRSFSPNLAGSFIFYLGEIAIGNEFYRRSILACEEMLPNLGKVTPHTASALTHYINGA